MNLCDKVKKMIRLSPHCGVSCGNRRCTRGQKTTRNEGGDSRQVAADAPFSWTKSIIHLAGKDRDTELSQPTTKPPFYVLSFRVLVHSSQAIPTKGPRFVHGNGVEVAWRTMDRRYTINPRPHNGNTTKTLAFVHKVATVEAVVTPKRTPASPPTISVCSSPLSVDVARGTCHSHSHADHIPPCPIFHFCLLDRAT